MHLKAPPLHMGLSVWSAGDSSSAAEVHRAYSRLVWRRETPDAAPLHRVLLKAALWPPLAVAHACSQLRRHGKWVKSRTRKSRVRQLREMVVLAFRHSVPPRAYTLFELFEPDHYANASGYLHRYETKRSVFWHLNRNLGSDAPVARDKVVFERRCRAEGIPTPEILLCAANGEFEGAADALRVLAGTDVVVKPVEGKGGRGIERWDAAGAGRHRSASGLECTTAELAAHIRGLAGAARILVQPTLHNHCALSDLSADVLLTARVMTGRDEDGHPEVLSAAFRIAVDSETVDNFHQGAIAAPVELETGRLGQATGLGARSAWYGLHPRSRAPIEGRFLPTWSEALDLVRAAHRAMPELVFVGWDVAFTLDGPVLVEANCDPDVNILQRPHKRPLGETRFGELLAHHLATIESSRGDARGRRERARGFVGDRPLVRAVAGLRKQRDVDAFVVSFPKCGRTWLRVQLGRALEGHFGLELEDLLELREAARQNAEIPNVRFLHAGRPQRMRPDELSSARVDEFRFRKVVLLVRDPRDVVVSMYMQRTKRGMEPRFDGTLSEFLHEPVGSFDTLLEFYNLWAERQGRGRRVLVVRYEDMHAAPARELRRVLDFIGLPGVDEAVVEDAVAFSSFDRMKEMEREDRMRNSRLRPGDPSDAESFKTRKGRVGGYREYLTEEEVASLEDRMRTSLRAYYGPS